MGTMDLRRTTSLPAMAASALMANTQAVDRSCQSSAFELAGMYPLLDHNGSSDGAVSRFAPVIQAQHTYNHDLGTRFGLFAGASVNTVGFI